MTQLTINPEVENPITMRELPETLLMHFRTNEPVMLSGDSGIGKTMGVHQACDMDGRKMFTFQTNISEPVDARGCPVPNMETRTTDWFVPNNLPKSDGSDGPSTLFIDEINTGSVMMMAVLMQLVVWPRKLGDYQLPDNCRVVAAGNRRKDSKAVHDMPKPLKTRFVNYTVVVDYDVFDEYAAASGLAPEIRAFVKFRKAAGVLLRQPVGDEWAYANPRSIVKCGKYVHEKPSLRVKAFIGSVGRDVGTEMEGFVSMYQSFTTIETILKDPDNAPVPSEPSHIYGVAAALSNIADRKTFRNVMAYAKRLPPDIGNMCVLTAAERDKKLTSVVGFSEWSTDTHAQLGV